MRNDSYNLRVQPIIIVNLGPAWCFEDIKEYAWLYNNLSKHESDEKQKVALLQWPEINIAVTLAQ